MKVLLIDDGNENISLLAKLLTEDAENEVIIATDEKDVSTLDKFGATIITSDMIEKEEEKKSFGDLDFLNMYDNHIIEIQNTHSDYEPFFHNESHFYMSDVVQKGKRNKKKRKRKK